MVLQDVLINSRRCKKPIEHDKANWNRIAEILWSHINHELEKPDHQLLCTTCFFSVLILTDKHSIYMNKVNDIIQKEINSRSDEEDTSNTFLAVSLMYGVFQSSLLLQTTENSVNIEVINSIFHLLTLIGYEYSQYTAIAFKILNSLKKVCGTDLQKVVFSEKNQIILLNLINHNWENPITGVRDLNKDIFQTLITVLDEATLNSIVQEINGFYWNKAKYLMLSEIIRHCNSDIMNFITECNIIEGLINSLHRPGLVSAGTDIYFAILNKIHSEDVWCEIFQSAVIEVLNGSSSKAIENFTNYWCIKTFKLFPILISMLIDELDKFDDTELKLYSITSLLKQGSKLAILNISWDSDNYDIPEKVVIKAIEHCNTQIRMMAFDILCLSQDKHLPNQMVYSLILEYIKNNINSDCTVLRLNMLNSFSTLMGQLHVMYRNLKDDQNIAERELLLNFCKNLQEFIITSLNSNGNYQRKSTNIKVIKIIIDCISEVPKKKKNYARCIGLSLREYVEQNNCWRLHDEGFVLELIRLLKDPSDDIRESVGNLLLNNYSEEIRHTNILNNLIQEALQSMKSKFFYEISCGQSMFKLLVNLLLREKHDEAIFKSVNDVFDYALKDLLAQYTLEQNILKSIEDGKQLHSFLNILLVVLDACLKSSYKLDTNDKTMETLLEVLKGITEQFTFEQNATSSDFSKMNEVVEDIIAEAGYDNQNMEKDETKISGLHQIVLNCLWLNVKASCDLASLLIRYNKEDVQKCEKCLTIITHVLETSRHKGAIEAAGAALGSGIQFLTSLTVDSKVSELPQTLLKTKLHTLILEASKMASITRRGAGLSIMVHRIVSSDLRKGKPLFHYFIKTLLKTCQETKDIPILQDKTNENQMDLPKAILIHFLSRIVTDSSLASDMMFYSAELAELAFSNLTSPHWQIRNAALQLYGALIPKLIGQRKQSGTDDEIMATVAYDELRTHSPKLWKFITKQLKNEHHIDKINSHSNLVPILNMIASCAKRYNFSYNLTEQVIADEGLLKSLMRVLDSPIHTVRRLASKCISNILTSQNIFDAIVNMDMTSENLLHGVLLLLKICHKCYNLQQIIDLHEKIQCMFKSKKHSYWSKEVFASLYPDDLNINDVTDIVSELSDNNINSPGVFLWAQTCIRNCIMGSQWEDIPKVLDLIFEQNLEMCYEIILSKLESEKCSEAVLLQIANYLLSSKNIRENGVIWKIMYKISQMINLNIDMVSVINIILSEGDKTKIKYIIPFTARFVDRFNEELQNYLVDIIDKLSDFEYIDVDMRYIAALANNELAKSLSKLSDNAKVSSVKIAIVLLQDEDEDVRNVAVYYYKNITNLEAVHPTISLRRILDYNFLYNVFHSHERITELCEDLIKFLTNNAHKHTDEYNPFANDSKNIYLEVNVLRTSLEYLKLVTSCQ